MLQVISPISLKSIDRCNDLKEKKIWTSQEVSDVSNLSDMRKKEQQILHYDQDNEVFTTECQQLPHYSPSQATSSKYDKVSSRNSDSEYIKKS